jgi:hypothetical protein
MAVSAGPQDQGQEVVEPGELTCLVSGLVGYPHLPASLTSSVLAQAVAIGLMLPTDSHIT